MENGTSKAQLLAELRDEQAGWDALLRDIGEEHMTQPDVAGGCEPGSRQDDSRGHGGG